MFIKEMELHLFLKILMKYLLLVCTGKEIILFKKEISDLDVPLKDETSGDEYIKLLEKSLRKIKNKIRPELIFYISGVDILETDKLGRLKVSREDCKKRDDMVFEFAQNQKVPVVSVMGGGYSEKIYDIVEAHCNTFKSMIHLI